MNKLNRRKISESSNNDEQYLGDLFVWLLRNVDSYTNHISSALRLIKFQYNASKRIFKILNRIDFQSDKSFAFIAQSTYLLKKNCETIKQKIEQIQSVNEEYNLANFSFSVHNITQRPHWLKTVNQINQDIGMNCKTCKAYLDNQNDSIMEILSFLDKPPPPHPNFRYLIRNNFFHIGFTLESIQEIFELITESVSKLEELTF